MFPSVEKTSLYSILFSLKYSLSIFHLSFDAFTGQDGRFPLFVPFYNHQIIFQNIDWVYFEVAAIVIIGIVTILTTRQARKIKASV